MRSYTLKTKPKPKIGITTMKMQINETKLIEDMRLAFTDKYSLIREMAQNARRAKAKTIKITYNTASGYLTFENDGQPITNFQNLISVSHSGWDEETKANQRPYGLGFLSVLYAAEADTTVNIESGNKFLTIDPQKLFKGEDIGTEREKDYPTYLYSLLQSNYIFDNTNVPEDRAASCALWDIYRAEGHGADPYEAIKIVFEEGEEIAQELLALAEETDNQLTQEGTAIHLYAKGLKILQIQQVFTYFDPEIKIEIRDSSRGIDEITYNELKCDDTHAYYHEGVGTVIIKGLPDIWELDTTGFTYIYQGFKAENPLENTYYRHSSEIIVNLDIQAYEARLPDRSTLVQFHEEEEEKVRHAVYSSLRDFIAELTDQDKGQLIHLMRDLHMHQAIAAMDNYSLADCFTPCSLEDFNLFSAETNRYTDRDTVNKADANTFYVRELQVQEDTYIAYLMAHITEGSVCTQSPKNETTLETVTKHLGLDLSDKNTTLMVNTKDLNLDASYEWKFYVVKDTSNMHAIPFIVDHVIDGEGGTAYLNLQHMDNQWEGLMFHMSDYEDHYNVRENDKPQEDARALHYQSTLQFEGLQDQSLYEQLVASIKAQAPYWNLPKELEGETIETPISDHNG